MVLSLSNRLVMMTNVLSVLVLRYKLKYNYFDHLTASKLHLAGFHCRLCLSI